MRHTTKAVICFLAALCGFAFGIFLSASLTLHEPLHVFSVAGLFAAICTLIAFHVTTNLVHRLSGRMIYWLAGFIVLSASAASLLLFIKAY